MKQVYKYVLPVDDQPDPYALDIPKGASPVHVECFDPYEVMVWFEVDTLAEAEERTFIVVGTGQAIPDGATHVGTAAVLGGALVWHLYEVTS